MGGEAIKFQKFILRTTLTDICIVKRNSKIGELWDVAPLGDCMTDHPTQAPPMNLRHRINYGIDA